MAKTEAVKRPGMDEKYEHILQRSKALCGAGTCNKDFHRGIDISHCVGNPCVDPEEGTCPKCYDIFTSRGVEVRLAGRG